MSRGYSGTDRSIIESAPLSVEPFTFSAWAAFDSDNNAGQVAIGLTNQTSTQDQAFLNVSFDVAGNPANFAIRKGGTFYQCYTANGVTANGGWNHLAGVNVGVAERYSYLNGDTANKGSTTTTYTTSLSGLLNRTCIGALYAQTTLTQTTQGRIAHPAIWSAALTDAEIVVLSQGVSPLLVRPDSLVFYMPYLGRDTNDIDIEGGRVLTLTGTTSSTAEPRVTRPTDKNSTKIFLPQTTGSVDFSAGSTSMARVAEAVRTSYPMSMFAMVKPYSVPAPVSSGDRQFGVLGLDASSTNLYFQRINLANSDLYNGVPAGNIVGLARSRNSSGSFKTTTGYFDVNQWGALGGTWATSTITPTIKVYRAGANETLPTQSDVNTTWPTQINETLIGRENISSGQTGRNFNGKISRVAIWGSVLSDAEMASLYNGASPLTIQLSNLVCYWPGSVITIAGVQYMEEVIQGKHAQLQNGAAWTTEEPSTITNATASGLLGTLNSFAVSATGSGGANGSGLIRGLSSSSITGSAVWYPGQRMYPNAAALTNLSGSFADIDDDPDSPDGSWLIQV